jgi:hypothetical protein
MSEKQNRDVEKVYSTSEFVSKLRRLADALERGQRFEIRVPEKGSTYPLVPSLTSSTNERETRKRSNSSLSGPTSDLLYRLVNRESLSFL